MITFASGLYDLLPLVSFSAEREPREREGAAAERDVGAGAVALPAAQGPPRRPQGLQGQLSLFFGTKFHKNNPVFLPLPTQVLVENDNDSLAFANFTLEAEANSVTVADLAPNIVYRVRAAAYNRQERIIA